MFNLNYFKYLIKSKKFLIFFVSLVSILFCLLGINTSAYWLYSLPNLLLSTVLAVAMPAIIFHFIHSKKAIDSYFSLSVSRRELLVTGVIFSWILAVIPSLITLVVGGIQDVFEIREFIDYSFIGALNVLLTVVLVSIVIILFVLLTYSFANSHIDGLIMVAAYSLLPVAVYLAAYIFMESFVYGYITSGIENVMLVSPFYSGGNLIINLIEGLAIDSAEEFPLRYLASELVQLVVYAFALYKTFIKRKVERAETPSKNFFAYPLMIYSYVAILLFAIGANYTPDYNLLDFLTDHFFLYLVVFVCFVVAHFVYKKKFYFDFKMPAFFIVSLAVSLLFCTAARETKGFGLAYNYKDFEPNTAYTIDISSNTDKDYVAFNKYLNDLTNDEIWRVNITITSANESTKSIVKRIRREAIDNYYKEGDFNSSTYIGIYQIKQDKDGYWYNNIYTHRYYSKFVLTIDEFKKLMEDSNIAITFEGSNSTYVLKNGHIVPDVFYDIVYE